MCDWGLCTVAFGLVLGTLSFSESEESWNWAAQGSAAVACAHWLSFQMCGDILKEITTLLCFWVIAVLDFGELF